MTFSEWAAAIALLTPLVLGLTALAKDIITRGDKKQAEQKAEPVAQGMTVTPDYAGELIQELRAEIKEKESELAAARARIAACEQIHK